MRVILSHINLDFDGLASMVAAGKLFPKSKLVLPEKVSLSVQQFLALYKDSIQLYHPRRLEWENIQQAVIVDTANLERLGIVKDKLTGVELTVYDHHPPTKDRVNAAWEKIESVGATVTLLVEELIAAGITVSPFEATIMALGIYTDTGSLSYLTTTPRDMKAAAFLLEKGANLALVNKFSVRPLLGEQQEFFNQLLANSTEYSLQGLDIMVAWHAQEKFQGGLALFTQKILELTGVDGLVIVVAMAKKTWVIARSASDRIDVLPLVARFGGGGHAKAASATIKQGDFQEVLARVEGLLDETVRPAVIAREIMTSPVKTVAPYTKVEDVAKVILRYGHNGLPVVEEDKLLGIISRRDVDKAMHHGLGHAPVKGYMSHEVITINGDTSLEEIQDLMIDNNLGRLPVMEDGQVVGIVTRTDVLNHLHGENVFDNWIQNQHNLLAVDKPSEKDFSTLMKKTFTNEIMIWLERIGSLGDETGQNVFLVGGIVRDLLLGHPSEDIDIVVEGDGIKFAQELGDVWGGRVTGHEKFGTATWKVNRELKIDLATARREYYEYPAALPAVERSDLREDLYRRDFSINAMAIQLNKVKKGCLIDYFHGYNDLREKKIRVLYNLSFVEDPTRILRAVRFENRFGFQMDDQTLGLALNSIDEISSVSMTRITAELRIMLKEPNQLAAIRRLASLGVWDYLVGGGPVEQGQIATLGRLEKLQRQLDNQGQPGEPAKEAMVWVGYLLGLCYPDYHRLSRFVLTNKEQEIIQEVQSLTAWWETWWEELAVSYLSDDQGAEKKLVGNPTSCAQQLTLGSLHRKLARFSIVAIIFMAAAKPPEVPEGLNRLLSYLVEREQLLLPIRGSDLIELGLKPGPEFTEILAALESALLDREVTTKDDALQWVKCYRKQA